MNEYALELKIACLIPGSTTMNVCLIKGNVK